MSSTSSQGNIRATISQPDYMLACPADVKELHHHQERYKLFQNPWPSFVDPGGAEVAFKILQRKLTGTAKNPDVTPPTIEDIPIVDAVVISHNHYDHMSYTSLKKLAAKHSEVQFFVPLNIKKWFDDNGFSNITELDWWQSTEATFTPPNEKPFSATISCLPAQHGSARTAWDRSRMLWAGWSIESGDKTLYFAGDTGYRTVPELPPSEDDYGEAYSNLPVCPAFKQIGELRGPFDLGIIPIGAYEPRFLYSSLHSNPYDSVNIFVDTKCKNALAMHWGAWVLTEEDVMEPARKLRDALRWKGLPEEGTFDVCDIGESREY
ncbi:related to Zn-dependent hydrolase (beta-lactamase superfamily) [Ramularia collo-cygni]|uniref:Related to Zn-dependent hydrolase (Beta-lactamase superfamily) n=1 Tax=Ramularia collo-cygni TaxID=112498 RepID=A0A2D3V4D4_9PEZI|nr:related to Zn-dependent hydrolase (beta-lactamase superfamily) [Ramularia collo-cygni]CZT15153.1 related to Zn-dependent hydrolase (beta-lactamase superfamily) [Ramularia collo-cygni]